VKRVLTFQTNITPLDFQYIIVPDGASKLMIASDGFVHHDKHKLEISRQQNPDLPACLNGQQWGKKGNVGLKKWMNTRHHLGYFADDCFVITAERREQND